MSVLGPGAVRDLLVVSQTLMYRVPISWGNEPIATNKKIEMFVQDVTDDIYINYGKLVFGTPLCNENDFDPIVDSIYGTVAESS